MKREQIRLVPPPVLAFRTGTGYMRLSCADFRAVYQHMSQPYEARI